MARHQQHDPQELDDALEHILYEMWKYRQSVAYYGQILHAASDAAIEFRVLHHRVLLEFFYGYPKHEDNIVAWEYVTSWQQTHVATAILWLENYMNRCHVMLAHVSKARTDVAKQGLKSWAGHWPIVEPHLDKTIQDFLGGLSPNHKTICSNWIIAWSKPNVPFHDVLAALAAPLK
jgi:hemoglobin-like flavoprotein